MHVLLAPVFESFLLEHEKCLAAGGFVVGPIGETTASNLFEFACMNGKRDDAVPSRFSFNPMLPAVVYESRASVGIGAYRYVGLVDEIEINDARQSYRFPKMKAGRGPHGEKDESERMPAYVRFRVLKPVGHVFSGKSKLLPSDIGQSDPVLRHFKFARVKNARLRDAFEDMLSHSLP